MWVRLCVHAWLMFSVTFYITFLIPSETTAYTDLNSNTTQGHKGPRIRVESPSNRPTGPLMYRARGASYCITVSITFCDTFTFSKKPLYIQTYSFLTQFKGAKTALQRAMALHILAHHNASRFSHVLHISANSQQRGSCFVLQPKVGTAPLLRP